MRGSWFLPAVLAACGAGENAGGSGAAKDAAAPASGGPTTGSPALSGATGVAAGAKSNVLVIVIDTLRADALGVYGQPRATSPHLDQFAKEAVVWEDAWTQYTWTLPSFVTYMTSTFARTNGWTYKMGQLDTYRAIATPAPTLAEILKGAGYHTVGAYSNEHLRADLGCDRGFDSWTKGAEQGVVRAAVTEIGGWTKDPAPDFLYVHLMATHVPLLPTAESLAAVGATAVADGGKGIGYDHWIKAPDDQKPARLEELRGAYYASTRDGDARVGEILAALDASGQRGHTVVAFFSDHGELLGEHGQAGHGPMIWDELTRVPLMIRAPGQEPRRVTDRIGRLVDLAPTLLTLVGVPVPAPWQGRSLFDGSDPLAVVERDHMIGFSEDGRFKSHEDRAKETPIFAFDLETDPGEASPIRDASQPWWQSLGRASASWRAATPVGANDGKALVLGADEHARTVEALKQLGYVE